MAILVLGAEIEVVRIPELPPKATLANDDAVPIWDASSNVTSKVSLSTLRTFIETGSGGTIDQILNGGSILYIASGGDGFTGTDSFVYPAIAGFSFVLERDGYPLKLGTEYLILAAGGFQLIGSTIIAEQRYRLDVFELYAGTIPPPSGVSSTGNSFIVGNTTVNTNVNIAAADMNKVHQIRGAGTAYTLTLPDVALVAANSFIAIEALINNTKQHRITTSGGQFIYINNQAKTSIYIAPGENVWLYRTADGWYAISDKLNYNDLGIPKPVFKVGLNQIALDGSLLNRVDYPRLWEYVQTLGASLVSDATWSTASVVLGARTVDFPYRGCWSTGNGSSTFRLPDFRSMAVRGLTNPGGGDTQRSFNSPGGFQRHEYEGHNHSLPDNIIINIADFGGESGSDNIALINPATTTGSSGGSETRMDNIGMIWAVNY